MMNQAFICDAIRTPFGRYGGALSSVRTDDLGAIPLRALMARNPGVDWAGVNDVYMGCVLQAGLGPAPGGDVLRLRDEAGLARLGLGEGRQVQRRPGQQIGQPLGMTAKFFQEHGQSPKVRGEANGVAALL